MVKEPAKPRGFQFSILRLLLLTLVVAVILAIAIQLDAPWVARACIGLYLIGLASWFVIRGPSLVNDLRSIWIERNRLTEKRQEMEQDIAKRRQQELNSE